MVHTSETVDKLPVVDLAKLLRVTAQELNADDPEVREIAHEFGRALHGTGFAYLINHGIQTEVVSKAFHESKVFFDLPTEQKMKYLKATESAASDFQGYISPGLEVLKKDGLTESIKVEKKEAFDLQNIKCRKFPKEEAPGFQPALESIENECKQLDAKLLKLLALSIELEDIDFFLRRTTHMADPDVTTRTVFRTLYYPPIPVEQDEDLKPNEPAISYVGCNEHTDWDILTLLFQDSVGGLEVKSKEGKWIPAPPVPDAIIVNTGDLLDAWTGGYFKATPHRVLVRQTEDESEVGLKKSMGRQSIAYFLFPDDEVLVSPLKSDLLLKNCAQQSMEPISTYEYFRFKANEAYAQY